MDPNKLSQIDGDPLLDITQYRRLIGRLSYLTLIRPNIAFTVNKLSQYVSKPHTSHAIHHFLRYLKASPGQGLLFLAQSNLTLTTYGDADWGNCLDIRKSTSGYCVFLGESLISWKSKKQPTVARSSAEVEYRVMANVTSEVEWLIKLLQDFGVSPGSVKLLCDNQAAQHIASNPTFHERTKHIEIDCHFVRERVQSELLKLIHVKSQHQLTDIMTKPLATTPFRSIMSKLGVKDIYAPT